MPPAGRWPWSWVQRMPSDPKARRTSSHALREAGDGGFDYALDTSGIPAVMKSAVDVLLPNGMLGLIGIPPPEAPMPMSIMDLYMRGLGVKCIVEGDADPQTFIPQLVDLYKREAAGGSPHQAVPLRADQRRFYRRNGWLGGQAGRVF